MVTSDGMLLRLAPAVTIAIALVCLGFSLRAGRRQLLVDNLPKSKTTGVFIGLVELEGTAETETPLTSFLARAPCVYFSYLIEEKSSRQVTETYTDDEGKTQTRTKTETEWTTVAQGDSGDVPFYLKDDQGTIRIQPAGAKVEPQTVFSRTCGRVDPLYYGKGPAEAVANSDHERRFVEQAIPLHAPLFVVGHARQREDIVAAEITKHPGAPLFLISTRAEKTVSHGLRLQFWIVGAVGLILVALFQILYVQHLHPDEFPFGWKLGAGCAAYLAAWLAGWVWMDYNSLVELRQRVRQGWANIDVELKRRADLLPNLVTMVSGLRDHERTLQTQLAAFRAQSQATAPGTPGADPVALAGQLKAVAEAYPDLKANSFFMNLQRQLVTTEDRIAMARSYFNDIATFYNTRLAVFPDRLVAALGGMSPQSLMEAAGFERAPAQLKLS
jgi:hypothetical protein